MLYMYLLELADPLREFEFTTRSVDVVKFFQKEDSKQPIYFSIHFN